MLTSHHATPAQGDGTSGFGSASTMYCLRFALGKLEMHLDL